MEGRLGKERLYQTPLNTRMSEVLSSKSSSEIYYSQGTSLSLELQPAADKRAGSSPDEADVDDLDESDERGSGHGRLKRLKHRLLSRSRQEA